MQCACAIQLFVACPALQYFSTFSHKRHDFRKKKKKVTEHITRVFSLQLFPETFLILRRNERDMNKNVHVPVIFVRFWWNLNFLDILSNNTQISNFMKICAVWEESFHADARTDRPKDITKLNTFSHFFCENSQTVPKLATLLSVLHIMHRKKYKYLYKQLLSDLMLHACRKKNHVRSVLVYLTLKWLDNTTANVTGPASRKMARSV